MPSLVVYHRATQTWKIPQRICCSEKGHQYTRRCIVFEVNTTLCGVQGQDQLHNQFSSCLVRLTKSKTPMERVTYDENGRYCLVTNHQKYLYGQLECQVTGPTFCFTPQNHTLIGHIMIYPVPIFENATIIMSDPTYQDRTVQSILTILIYIPPLNLQLKQLMEQKTNTLYKLPITSMRQGNLILI